MKSFKLITILLLFFSLSSFAMLHKYYISVTQVEYVKEKKTIQIISRIFIDDFENVLKERYDENIIFDDENSKMNDSFIQKYLGLKLKMRINDKVVTPVFIGKETDTDIVKCYLEIENIEAVNSFEISNKILFDLFTDQQNIIKINVNSKQKSYVHTSQNDKTLLKFN